jgi:hypothetical protein
MGKGQRNRAARRGGKSSKDIYRSCSEAGVLKADLAAIESSEEKTGARESAIDEKHLFKLYSSIATNVWRMKNQILDMETKEPKDGLDGRSVAKIARYLASLDGALEDAGVQVVGDYNGKPHDEGNAVKVISYEDRADLKRDEYIETLLPTVRWTNEQGQTRLLQQAEVVVGRPAVANQ